MPCQYDSYPYAQYNQGHTAGTQQMNSPAQTQTYTRNMQTAPISPLAGSLYGMPPGITPGSPILPLSSLAGATKGATVTPLAESMPVMPSGVETPPTVQSPYYTAGFLKKFIGKNVRVEFVMGTSGSLTDRVGTLLEVGASYIVIQPLLTDDLLMCDLYSIRFVTIFG
jgi:hypothetical protein